MTTAPTCSLKKVTLFLSKQITKIECLGPE